MVAQDRDQKRWSWGLDSLTFVVDVQMVYLVDKTLFLYHYPETYHNLNKK